ncbi:AraC family transcriptional regulator [Novosphingobium resinovorum]|uniref:AraC family transcriptional regulator n=1 Tax=Novosphingobium resinovorum TaxID=158500 RepID=A0A1D8ADP7_9SPHN|nr:helix-turn-helix transcriptional regulator [Novosphingobium resinovorum]AOR80247.1 AraC family transcriptional regulator [Novosphingobium resinovorum]
MIEERFALAASDALEPVIIAIYETQAEYRHLGMHQHPRGQLSGLRRGILTMGTEAGAWVVPADHAAWLPPRQPHYGYTHGAVDGWSCYISESACASLPNRPCTIKASALLREAVIRASRWDGGAMDEPQERIALLILDELRAAPVEPFSLAMPRDPRLLLIARALLDDPGDRRGMDAWALWAGVSERTLSRRFVAETGYSYTTWRQRARLMRALEMLAEGGAVTTVALDLGYDSVSAFIAMFKRMLGETPAVYFNGA